MGKQKYNYYILEYDEEGLDASAILSRPVIPGFEDIAFDLCTPVKEQLPTIKFIKEKDNQGKVLDYVLTMLRGLVISERFREALENAQVKTIDYHPAEIDDRSTGEVLSGFFVANIIGCIACVDRQKSSCTARAAFPDEIREIQDLHLDYDKIRGQKIFRLEEKASIIIIDEEVRDSIANAELTGVKTLPAEGYST